jgi:putrescine transport system ATP-binding protein
MAGEKRSVGAVRRAFAPWTDPAAKPLIRFENVVKRYGDTTAVGGVSLDIYEREFFTLLGPSGCGKTTLMRMLAGFEAPSEGRVTLAGQDLAGQPPHLRPVNMMFQSYALFPHMSVAENVAFGLKMAAMPKGEIEARVQQMLALVKLETFAKRKPDQLSGGQRQRVALARALARKPKVLLLDEPLGALDKKLREETQFELMDLQMELGLTFLIVTHDQDEAMTMSDRIAVMDQGKVIQVATPSDIYERPSCRYVAGFVGEMNITEGVAGAVEAGVAAIAGANGATYRVALEEPLAPGEQVAVAVRPEKMAISHDPPPEGAANWRQGVVWDIGYLGDWTTYLIDVNGERVRVARANATRTVERPIGWDDQVWFGFRPDAAVILRS